MTNNPALFRRIPRGIFWLGLVLGFSLAVSAAQRKPKRQENAPQIRPQLLEQQLANPTLSPDQRARLFIDLALTDYHLKDFSDEALVLEDALATGTTNATVLSDAHYYLGRSYQALGESQEAEGEFNTVWQQYPTSQYQLYAAMQLGNLALDAGDTESATEWYHTIITNAPLVKLAFLARDRLRAMSNGVSAAEITNESDRPVYLKEKFRLLDQYLYSQLNTNADSLAQQLSAVPTNAAQEAAMSYHLVHHYWMYGNAEGASQFLNQSLNTTGSRHVQALILAGHVERALGQMGQALGYYGQAIAAAPAEPRTISAYQQSVRLLLRAGNEPAALAMASAGQQAFASSTKLPAYLDRLSTALRDGADSNWRGYAVQVVATATNELARRALMQLANDARLRRDWPSMTTFYQQLAAHPSRSWRSNVDAQIHLIDAQLNQTNTAGAAQTEQALLSQVIALTAATASTSNTTLTTANSISLSSNVTTGTTNLTSRKAYQLLPSSDASAYATYRLGKTWLVGGYTNNAMTRWQEMISSYPSSAFAGMAQIEMARVAEASGNLTNAAALYKSYISRTDMGSRRQLYAYANLIRIEEVLGDRTDTSLNLQAVQTAVLASGDPELQFDVAQYLWQHNTKKPADQALAGQFFETGFTNALAQIHAEQDPHKRLWWEYLIARRLDAYWDYGQLAQQLTLFQPDLQNKSLNDQMRYATCYLLIRALEKTGHLSQAQAMCQQLISSVPDDSLFVGHVLYRLSQEAKAQGDSVTVRSLAIAAFQNQPVTSLFAQQMYLETAIEDFNQGNYAAALAKAIQLEQAVPMSPSKPWAAHFRWDCQYLHGRCLVAQNNSAAGQPLIAEALAQKPTIPFSMQLSGLSAGTR